MGLYRVTSRYGCERREGGIKTMTMARCAHKMHTAPTAWPTRGTAQLESIDMSTEHQNHRLQIYAEL